MVSLKDTFVVIGISSQIPVLGDRLNFILQNKKSIVVSKGLRAAFRARGSGFDSRTITNVLLLHSQFTVTSTLDVGSLTLSTFSIHAQLSYLKTPFLPLWYNSPLDLLLVLGMSVIQQSQFVNNILLVAIGFLSRHFQACARRHLWRKHLHSL